MYSRLFDFWALVFRSASERRQKEMRRVCNEYGMCTEVFSCTRSTCCSQPSGIDLQSLYLYTLARIRTSHTQIARRLTCGITWPCAVCVWKDLLHMKWRYCMKYGREERCNILECRALFLALQQNLYGSIDPSIQSKEIHCVLFWVGQFSSRSY